MAGLHDAWGPWRTLGTKELQWEPDRCTLTLDLLRLWLSGRSPGECLGGLLDSSGCGEVSVHVTDDRLIPATIRPRDAR